MGRSKRSHGTKKPPHCNWKAAPTCCNWRRAWAVTKPNIAKNKSVNKHCEAEEGREQGGGECTADHITKAWNTCHLALYREGMVTASKPSGPRLSPGHFPARRALSWLSLAFMNSTHPPGPKTCHPPASASGLPGPDRIHLLGCSRVRPSPAAGLQRQVPSCPSWCLGPVPGTSQGTMNTPHWPPPMDQPPSQTHLILQVDVSGATVELFLQAGYHCIVAWDSVNARGLQPPCLHNSTACSHDQGDTLETQAGQGC